MAAFYLPFARFWELMIGGVLAYVLLHRPFFMGKHKELQACFGFMLIFAGFLLLNKEKHFPGWWALLPTAGAFLTLSAGPTARLNKKLLANKFMIGIGLISYPLYLWHWSILSFLYILEGHASTLLRLTAVGSAVLLAWLTYRFVEKPIRAGKHAELASVSLPTMMMLIFAVAMISHKTHLLERADERTAYTAYFDNALPAWGYFTREKILEKFRADCDFYNLEKYRQGQVTSIPRASIAKGCYTRLPAYAHSVLLWGDSHAQQLYEGLANQLPKDWQILLGASSGCGPNPLVNGPSKTNYCEQSNWVALQTIKTAKPDVVIVAQEQGHTLEKMKLITHKLQKLGVKKIIFTGPVPEWDLPLHMIVARKFWRHTPRRTTVGLKQHIIDLNQHLVTHFKETKGVVFVDLMHVLCNEKGCLTYIGKDRKTGLTAFDTEHLTSIASNKLAKEVLVEKIIS